jgi:hypothetical protein
MNQIRTYTKSNQLNMKLQGDFQRLVCFRDGRGVKTTTIKMGFSDSHEGWKYWSDHVK